MKRKRCLLSLILVAHVFACCLNRIDLDKFYKSSLDQQIAAYEMARSKGCVYSERGALLQAISRHGYPAAEIMIERLNHPRQGFPQEDAISVLEFVHFGGADLRNHEALRVLENIAKTSPDANVREEAERSIRKIKSNDPLAGTKHGPGEERDHG